MSQYTITWGVGRVRMVTTDDPSAAQTMAQALYQAGWPGLSVVDTTNGRTIPWRTVNWRQW